ncbi:MAG: ribonuclease HI [Candidatus Cloacimonadota bacterium]|nr:MAG: ribonuclease HI [Candidatus Cloacimonadota bacterium]
MKKIIIYTDGSCLKNPGRGGYAAILFFNQHKKIIKGRVKKTTNNQMELMAVIESLRSIKEPCEIELYSDSQYVLNGLKTWMKSWKKNSWKNSKKEEVKNKDLWIELDKLREQHKMNYHWVKAHNGNKYNEEVDQLANDEAHKA